MDLLVYSAGERRLAILKTDGQVEFAADLTMQEAQGLVVSLLWEIAELRGLAPSEPTSD